MDGHPTFDSQTCENGMASARAQTLDQHLLRVDVFKLGLRNSLGIDFRSASHPVLGDDQEVTSRRFHYLAEVFPFITPRVNALDAQHRRAYETLKEEALESFWQIYANFQPLMRSVSTVLHRLDLPHDERRLERIARTVTSATLRKRAARLLVRLMAARYCNQAPRFGVLLKATPSAARNRIRQLIDQCASERSSKASQLINETLNWISLSDSVYKISISERGKLAGYLSQTPRSPISSAVFQKLKAALIEQERLDFPCWSSDNGPLPARCASE